MKRKPTKEKQTFIRSVRWTEEEGKKLEKIAKQLSKQGNSVGVATLASQATIEKYLQV